MKELNKLAEVDVDRFFKDLREKLPVRVIKRILVLSETEGVNIGEIVDKSTNDYANILIDKLEKQKKIK